MKIYSLYKCTEECGNESESEIDDDIISNNINNLKLTSPNIPSIYKSYIQQYIDNKRNFIQTNIDDLLNFQFDFTKFSWILKKPIVLRTFFVEHGSIKCKVPKKEEPFIMNKKIWQNKEYKTEKRKFMQTYILDPFNWMLETLYGDSACYYKLDRNTIRHKTNDGLIVQILPKEFKKTERNRDPSKEKFCLLKMKVNNKKIWFTLELDGIQ